MLHRVRRESVPGLILRLISGRAAALVGELLKRGISISAIALSCSARHDRTGYDLFNLCPWDRSPQFWPALPNPATAPRERVVWMPEPSVQQFLMIVALQAALIATPEVHAGAGETLSATLQDRRKRSTRKHRRTAPGC